MDTEIRTMNNVFVWLTDITEYAEKHHLSPERVFDRMIATSRGHGFACDKVWSDLVPNQTQPLKGFSMEVDDIDGLCFSFGIDQEDFRKITVDDWLSYSQEAA